MTVSGLLVLGFYPFHLLTFYASDGIIKVETTKGDILYD